MYIKVLSKDREILLRKSAHTLQKHISYQFIDDQYNLFL